MYIRTNIHGYRLIKYIYKKNIYIVIFYIYIYIYIYIYTYYTHTYIFSVCYTFSKITKREVPLQNTLYKYVYIYTRTALYLYGVNLS